MLGPNLMKVQRSIARRLVTTNYKALRNNNITVKGKYEEHRIVHKPKNMIALSDEHNGRLPTWLAEKINRLHAEMDEYRLHAERKCRKILTPAAPFRPEVQYWYNRIHALKLMRRMILTPKGRHNTSNNFYFASYMIDNPKSYNLIQIADGIRYYKLKQKEARNRAESTREEMMRERETSSCN